MRNIIYAIIQKHYGESGQIMTASGELEDIIKEFIVWKDSADYHFTPHCDIINEELRIHYSNDNSNRMTFKDVFDYWYNEIYIKKKRL